MENSESSSRKISPCDIGSSGDPGDYRSSPPKRGRVEHRAMGSFLENRPVLTSEAMAGSADDDHEEAELDLTLRLDLPRPTQKHRVQFQEPAVEDEIAKLEAIRAELGRAKEENSFRKKMLSEATAETVALQHRRSKLLLEGRNKQANQATEKEEDDEDRPSSSSNPDQAAPNMKKPQVSLRIRTEQPMIQDGCRWKKYGQKKLGSVFPRAYYRCVLLKQCPVKKRVQRCAEDPTVLITTYEGSHNHLLPDAAVATAQGTSEAMSMLLSGSLSSTDSASSSISSNSFLAGATISAINPFPSVLVDYTRPPAAVPRICDLTGTIFSDPEFNAAVVAAVIATSRALGADLDGGQEDAKKE